MTIEILLIIFISVNTLLLFKFKASFETKINGKINNDFSIIIAVKNEEKNIGNLIYALDSIIYPKESHEIIIVDDGSSDNTLKVIENNITGKKRYSLFKLENGKGKKAALEFGISKAKNNLILITDADCFPQKNWISSYNKFINNYDFLFGIAPFYQRENLINKISCFENLRTTFLTIASAKTGIPYSASARNFGFKKEAFNKLNRYSKILKTAGGDDDLLLQEAVKNKLKIGIITFPDSYVYSEAKTSLKEYIHQKSRHTKTSIYYQLKSKTLLAFWHLLNLFFLFSPILFFVDSFFILLFFVKISYDFIIVLSSQKKLSYHFKLYQICYLQILYEFFIIINFFSAIFLKPKWK